MRAERAGALAVAAGALLWSLAGVGIKAVPDAPLTVTFYRSLFAAITLFVVARKPLPLRANEEGNRDRALSEHQKQDEKQDDE